ncbi:MAG: LPS export ABC transporter periplasmic protein LptC [Ignavibacteria bacterium]|nr:LPS export ABC transporter periplasmic protein LptC [Ignavibacteria bacterium]
MRAGGALLLLLLCFASCEDRVRPPVSMTTGQQMPDQESWNSQVVFSDSGSVRAVLDAAHIRMYEERRETLLDSGLVVNFYDRDGKHSSRLTSDRGKVNDQTRDLEAFDNVVFTSDSGTVVKTDYLFWDNAKKKVRSDRFVTVTSPKERLQGYGFEADQGLKNYVVYRVSGEAQVQEKVKQ